jgi:capsule polysaccharide export protein KpsE/RkpR
LFIISATTSTGFFPSAQKKKEAAIASAQIAKLAIQSLDSLVRTRISTRSKRKVVLIEKLLAEKRHQLDSIEKEIENFQTKNKIIALDEQSKAILSTAINIGSELAKSEIELALYQSEYEPNSPVIQALRDKIQKLREQYNKVQSGGLTGTEAFSIPLEKMPSLLRIYMNLLREQKVLEQVSIFLETQKYSETIQEQTEIPGVDILDSPTIPSKPYSPNRVLITFFTFLFSLVFSVVLVNIREWKLANNKKREA